MEKLWTWGGDFFGYKDNDKLWTYSGKNVGKFYNDEVYGADGRYLGEIKNGRLITKKSRKNFRKFSFSPYANRVGIVKNVNYVGYVMYAGCEDFPHPDSF